MNRSAARTFLAALAVLALTAVGTVGAQADPARSSFSCGHPTGDDEARAGYFRDLCRAVLVAVHGSGAAPDPVPLMAEDAAAALDRGEVPLVYALPFELRADAGYVLGPVVWIGNDGRWAAAHAPGRPRAGELGAWLFHALVQAEAWGVDRAVLEGGLDGDVGERFLAYEARLVEQLDLPADALRTTIAAVGHHGEIRDRWFDVEAGPNRPVELGGQLYAPPVSPE
jgi:hypothetical protein